MYYANNFDSHKDILDEFEEEEAKAIKETKKLLKSLNLRAYLAFIKANLSFLPHYITKLEKQGIELTNAMQKIPGFDRIKSISKVLSGSSTTFPEGMSPVDVAMFKYCLTASVDVERSFSSYKNSMMIGSLLTSSRLYISLQLSL